MTAREKLAIEQPDKVNPLRIGGAEGCPSNYGYLPRYEGCEGGYCNASHERCTACWDREVPDDITTMEVRNTMLEELKFTKGAIRCVDYKAECENLTAALREYEKTIENQKTMLMDLEEDIRELTIANDQLRETLASQANTLEKYEMIVRCCEAFVGRPLVNRPEEV